MHPILFFLFFSLSTDESLILVWPLGNELGGAVINRGVGRRTTLCCSSQSGEPVGSVID